MAIFQHSILQKQFHTLDDALIVEKWNIFKSRFLNPIIQENIRNNKEEQYQEGFLRDLFVSVLGYTLNPSENYNLTTEYKNVKDSKKADGAIIIGNKVKAVIELKGNDTTDLDKIEPQAFGYKNNQPDCTYIIISNFEKLRFYIDNAVDKLEFNLFQLTEDEFKLLWLCLSYQSIESDFPATLKNASITNEENITKELYKDYSQFKRDLYKNLVEFNPQYDELLLFKKSQKLLDRFLFILFAEDRELLPENSIRKILDQWNQLKEMDAYDPLYNRYKKYFGYMNTGFKGKESDIFAYNGGLFKPDEILDNITIDDEILYKHTLKLSAYDFASDVDVNILGHIFENSLNEIEEIKAQSEGQEVDKSQTKRKKDGVFYTPKYITKYIVENTVGKLCEEKRDELNITDEAYQPSEKRSRKKLDNLQFYRDWLLQLTIVDPACGSGAFLNEALNFLIAQHRYIDELSAKYNKDSLMLSDVENSILENNLFGVDLNEESVEIAKLSLWLRTAQPQRKLNSLNNNIKCGNSLIDDPEIAGDKAFNWQKEFPNVFALKDKKIWHVTTATHNSRYSQRMFDNHVNLGAAEWIDTDDEKIITETVAEIVKEDNLNVLEYNLCGDHLHLLIVCEAEELPNVVKKIKGRTARKRNANKGINPLVQSRTDGETETEIGSEPSVPLWTQKFGKTEVNSDEYLANVLEYIRNNRVKHELPPNFEIEKLKKTFLCTVEHALRPEYKGGFDVVIGNPPYVRLESIREVSLGLEKMNYTTYEKRGDLYGLFVERGINILKQKGIISYIMPNKWLQASYGEPLRKFVLNYEFRELIDFGDFQIFEGATTYPCIFNIKKDKPKEKINISVLKENNKTDFYTEVLNSREIFNHNEFNGETWVISSQKNKHLLEKVSSKFKTLSETINYYNRGIIPGLSEAFIIDENKKEELIKNDENSKKIIGSLLRGRDITRYGTPLRQNLDYIILAGYGSYKYLEIDFNGIFKYLSQFEEKLKSRGQCKGSQPTEEKPFYGQHHWLELDNNPTQEYLNQFLGHKIMYQVFQVKPNFIFDEQGLYCNNSMWIIPSNDKGLLAILNSKMGWWLITQYCTQIQNGYQLIWKYFGQIPIANTSSDLAEKADQMLSLNKELQEVTEKFQHNIEREFYISKLSTKLQNWHELTYPEFLKELAKAKANLSLSQKAEWEDYFTTEQQKADALKYQIATTDKEIDSMVYKLYGLTEEEVKIVEGE